MTSTSLQLDEDSGYYVGVGELVAGKYRVEKVLGAGGMAFVLAARHVELDELFALKFLDERFLGNASIIERFTQEAKAACKIRSEHVARVYDVGVHGGAPFFVMEHLDGRDLSAVLAESGALPVEDAVEYVMQACEALAVAHKHGIIHRDIKPENLFLLERNGLPVIKILDFGISKVALTDGAPVSRLTGDLTLGTPCYMSPEQIRSTASVDARSDQWSLGIVLYELLTGTEAFRADSVNAVCAAVLEVEPEPMTSFRTDLPMELVDVVTRCFEKLPDARFADVGELAMALLPFAPSRALVSAERSSFVMREARRTDPRDQRISSVRPITTSTPAPSSVSRSPRASVPLANKNKRGKRSKLGTWVAVAVALGAVTGGVLAWRTHRPVAVAAVQPVPRPAVPLPTPVVSHAAAIERQIERAPEAVLAVMPVAKRVTQVPVAAPRAPQLAPPAPAVKAAPSVTAEAPSTPSAAPRSSSVELGY
jgi:serine/threonine-protein kinase